MDFVIVCKPAWWGTSSRIPDTAGYMARTANKARKKYANPKTNHQN